MSRFRIDHPSRPDIYADAGHDPILGYFAETFIEGRDKPTVVLDIFTLGRTVTLQDIFEFLISESFMTRDQLEAALMYLQDGGRRPRDMRVVELIERFKAAAD